MRYAAIHTHTSHYCSASLLVWTSHIGLMQTDRDTRPRDLHKSLAKCLVSETKTMNSQLTFTVVL